MDTAKWLLLLGLVVSYSCICAHTAIIRYDDIPFITPEQMQNNIPHLPRELRYEVDRWNSQYGGIIQQLAELPKTVQTFERAVQKTSSHQEYSKIPHNIATFNQIYKTKRVIIKIPGLHNALAERCSALGIVRSNKDQRECVGGYSAILNTEKPRHQGISRFFTARMLKKLNNSVQAPETWLYHVKNRPHTLDDSNYVVVQRLLPPHLIPFTQLTPVQKKQALKQLSLLDVYNAIKVTALWDFKEKDTYIDPADMKKIWFVDLEKPSNEAYDPSAPRAERGNVFRNVAVYGKDKDKWKFNVYDNAYKQVKSCIQQNAPERVSEWEQLKAQDPDSK